MNKMKPNSKIIISAFATSVLAFSTLAQNTMSPKMAEAQSASQGMPQDRLVRLNDTAKASDVMGMAVKNNQDEKLGTVKNFAVDVESGRIVQVIISSGGLLGMDATLTPVPPGSCYIMRPAKITFNWMPARTSSMPRPNVMPRSGKRTRNPIA